MATRRSIHTVFNAFCVVGLITGAGPATGAAPVPPPPATVPGCDKADIARRVRDQALRLRHCYEDALFRKPALAGTIAVQWTIGQQGSVTAARAVTDTMGEPEVTTCVVGVISGTTFAKPPNGICVIQWPFVFSPG